jgi:hypothetical protein
MEQDKFEPYKLRGEHTRRFPLLGGSANKSASNPKFILL